MIEKIISDGSDGAGRAALDAANKLGIAHGGWALNGETAEDSPLPEKYALEKLPPDTPTEMTRKNIQESGGTLILSYGPFKGPADFVKKIAGGLHKPVLHIDLGKTVAFNAATRINDWIVDHDIMVLNVTGAGSKEDPKIYQATLDILQAVFFLNLTESNMSNPIHARRAVPADEPAAPPSTVEDAVTSVLNDMTLKDRATMANLREEDLAPLQLTLGLYIKGRLDHWLANDKFAASCISAARQEGMDESNPTMLLIKKLWQRLKQTHRLRIVK